MRPRKLHFDKLSEVFMHIKETIAPEESGMYKGSLVGGESGIRVYSLLI